MQLSMRNLLLTVHIAVTAGSLGMDLVMLVLGLTGWSGGDPLTIYPAAHLIGSWLLAPAAGLSLATGLVLTQITSWKVTRHGWVAAKLAITGMLNGAVLFGLLPRLRMLAEASASGESALGAADRFFPAAAASVGAVLLIAAIALSVFKPRWPLRRSAEPVTAAP